jgi:hypothetical protein
MKGAMVPGSVRNGGGLLVGLLRCGHCGRKLKVQHNGLRGVARDICNDADINHATQEKCIALGNMRGDAAVSAEVLRVISPLALDAAFQLIADRERAGTEQLRHNALALEQARYEATRARRQYDAVDPDNRLVASELERRWNECLAVAARLLPVPYYHAVFTLPGAIADIAYHNQAVVYDLLLKAAAETLRKVEWVVYAKRPFGGPEAVLAYLSRYTHRIAIANSRLVAFDGEYVTFKWKDYRAKGDGRYKLMTLDADEFIRRFLIHVLPDGFHRIRHEVNDSNVLDP